MSPLYCLKNYTNNLGDTNCLFVYVGDAACSTHWSHRSCPPSELDGPRCPHLYFLFLADRDIQYNIR